VVVVVFDGFQSLDAVGPVEVFDHASAALGRRVYRVELVAPAAGPIRASSGLGVVAEQALSSVDPGGIDTLVVAGGLGVYPALDSSEVIGGIARLARSARRVASVCTGAYLLAEAGLLDGLRVTTHWMACDDLARRYPAVEVDPEPIFVDHGTVATSAGVSAGMDLALHFVEQDHGRELALDVARALVLFLRRPGNQAQLSAPLTGQLADSATWSDLQRWVVENLDRDLSVAELAARANQSPRTFARRFTSEVGITPARWVEGLRLEQARRLLEETDQPVDRVARRCGLRPESIRRLFHRHLGVGPREYRDRFGAFHAARPTTPRSMS
jgi:transcriptional regulator GlxA family with amidase domain